MDRRADGGAVSSDKAAPFVSLPVPKRKPDPVAITHPGAVDMSATGSPVLARIKAGVATEREHPSYKPLVPMDESPETIVRELAKRRLETLTHDAAHGVTVDPLELLRLQKVLAASGENDRVEGLERLTDAELDQIEEILNRSKRGQAPPPAWTADLVHVRPLGDTPSPAMRLILGLVRAGAVPEILPERTDPMPMHVPVEHVPLSATAIKGVASLLRIASPAFAAAFDKI
jgi:hypothetical protein